VKRGLALVLAAVQAGAAVAGPPVRAASPAASASASSSPMTAAQLILQFKRPALQAALRQTPTTPASRAAVRQALAALGARHGVALHHLQTLAVGSALVAVTPAQAQLDALVVRLAADPEVEMVEVNARMTHFAPPQR
jgi:hypothetical protein